MNYKITFYLNNCTLCPFFSLTSLKIAYCKFTNKDIYIFDLEKDLDEDVKKFENVVLWKNGKPEFCPAVEVVDGD